MHGEPLLSRCAGVVRFPAPLPLEQTVLTQDALNQLGTFPMATHSHPGAFKSRFTITANSPASAPGVPTSRDHVIGTINDFDEFSQLTDDKRETLVNDLLDAIGFAGAGIS